MAAQLARLKDRLEGGETAQWTKLEIILSKHRQMLSPAIERKHIVVAQGKDDPDRLRIRIEIIEERVLFCDQAGNRRRNAAMKQDCDSIANLFHQTFPLSAAREDFLELVKDEMSNSGPLRAPVNAKPKPACRILGKIEERDLF